MDDTMDHEQGVLPGFRFHPTDEELVSFYLLKKIEKKLISIEFIKQMDIYKYDPWDIPKNNSSVTDKEWYFFCKRGRKYRNSIRPNRVTASGFWKATGIDKPIYSVQGQGGRHDRIVGLKKSLVYYRGSAGKGTKTDWMMHEFRLPADRKNNTSPLNAKAADKEVEIWTLCRIFKKNLSERKSKSTPECWREVLSVTNSRPKAGNMEYSEKEEERYISFGAPEFLDTEKKPFVVGDNHNITTNERKQLHAVVSDPESCSSTVLSDEAMQFIAHGNWDEIVSAMDYHFDHHPYHFLIN